MSEEENDVAAQLKRLGSLTGPQLRTRWKETFRRPHPGWVQREFLVRALAYQVQENAYGGLTAALKRRLMAYADEVRKKGSDISIARPRIKAGTRLVREWGGETHAVTTLEQGFEYRSKTYNSLSEIARAITKTRWSGPAFFGLNRPADNKKKDDHGRRQ